MQGLPAISVQGLSESSLVNHESHLDAIGMHQPWSSTITSAIDCCWVPASECLDHVHFSSSGFAVKRFARYVLISCCSTFCICFFLRSFAILSTLFVHPSQPTHYSQFCLCFAPNCKSYCGSFIGSLATSATVRGRPRLLASSPSPAFQPSTIAVIYLCVISLWMFLLIHLASRSASKLLKLTSSGKGATICLGLVLLLFPQFKQLLPSLTVGVTLLAPCSFSRMAFLFVALYLRTD